MFYPFFLLEEVVGAGRKVFLLDLYFIYSQAYAILVPKAFFMPEKTMSIIHMIADSSPPNAI